MSAFYRDEHGHRWMQLGAWPLPLNEYQERLKIDWRHKADAAGTDYHEITKGGAYALHIKINPALEAEPMTPTAKTEAA